MLFSPHITIVCRAHSSLQCPLKKAVLFKVATATASAAGILVLTLSTNHNKREHNDSRLPSCLQCTQALLDKDGTFVNNLSWFSLDLSHLFSFFFCIVLLITIGNSISEELVWKEWLNYSSSLHSHGCKQTLLPPLLNKLTHLSQDPWACLPAGDNSPLASITWYRATCVRGKLLGALKYSLHRLASFAGYIAATLWLKAVITTLLHILLF